MVKNPLIRSYPRRVNKPQPNKSAGILDDYAVRKNVATKEGTIEKVPVNDSDIANKKYVDDENLWEVDGTETQLKTARDLDIRSKDLNNVNAISVGVGGMSISGDINGGNVILEGDQVIDPTNTGDLTLTIGASSDASHTGRLYIKETDGGDNREAIVLEHQDDSGTTIRWRRGGLNQAYIKDPSPDQLIINADNGVEIATGLICTGNFNVTGTASTGKIEVASNFKVQFRDSAIFIHSDADGKMHLEADTEITIASPDVRIGKGATGVDYTLTFDGENSDGVITWKEDEDRFECADEFRVNDDFHVTGESFQPHAQTQPARALNTTYQNTTGHPIIVYGSVKCIATDDGVNFTAYCTCKTDGNNPPTTIVQDSGIGGMAVIVINNLALDERASFYMVVKDNDYYRVDSVIAGNASVTLQYWNEVDF